MHKAFTLTLLLALTPLLAVGIMWALDGNDLTMSGGGLVALIFLALVGAALTAVGGLTWGLGRRRQRVSIVGQIVSACGIALCVFVLAWPIALSPLAQSNGATAATD